MRNLSPLAIVIARVSTPVQETSKTMPTATLVSPVHLFSVVVFSVRDAHTTQDYYQWKTTLFSGSFF